MLLALNKVEGDNVSGVCFVGLYDLDALRYFVLAPLCVGVSVGLFLILAGIVSLNHVRQVIQHDERNQEKLKKFMIRIGVFSCLYLVPLVTLLACYTYEQSHRSSWENTWIDLNHSELYDFCREVDIHDDVTKIKVHCGVEGCRKSEVWGIQTIVWVEGEYGRH